MSVKGNRLIILKGNSEDNMHSGAGEGCQSYSEPDAPFHRSLTGGSGVDI
jgi:hypothetical protein